MSSQTQLREVALWCLCIVAAVIGESIHQFPEADSA
jgi:hypothetical protein